MKSITHLASETLADPAFEKWIQKQKMRKTWARSNESESNKLEEVQPGDSSDADAITKIPSLNTSESDRTLSGNSRHPVPEPVSIETGSLVPRHDDNIMSMGSNIGSMVGAEESSFAISDQSAYQQLQFAPQSGNVSNTKRSTAMATRMETSVPNMCQSIRSNYASSTKHVVLLDWDDTVMPSTYLISNVAFKADRSTRKVTSIWLKPESKHKEQEICQSMKEAGTAALALLRNLYYYFVDSTAGRNLLIVTNAERDWFWNSLIVAGALSPIYYEIKKFLRDHKTQIIYARNEKLEHRYWKITSFNWILERYLEQRRTQRLNVITIGDQWTDHRSIEMSPVFERHSYSVSHHQIKLFPNSDARYIAEELNFIADLFVSNESSHSILLDFATSGSDAVLIEFDGYVQKAKEPKTPMRDPTPDSVYSSDSESISDVSYPLAQPMPAMPVAPVQLGHGQPAMYQNDNNQSGMDVQSPSVMPMYQYAYPTMTGYSVPRNYSNMENYY